MLLRANSALHARYPELFLQVKVVTNYLAHIVYSHHGYIRPHRGQGIDRCFPIVHRLFIGQKHGDLHLLCPGNRPRRGTFDFEHPCNHFLLQCRESQVTLNKELNQISFQCAGLHTFFLLAAAWVDPGRSALQSAEQRCQRRYGRGS